MIKQQLAINLKINALSVLTKYSKLSPILEDTDTTYPPNSYTFSHFLIPSLPTILLYFPPAPITSLPVTLFDYASDDHI